MSPAPPDLLASPRRLGPALSALAIAALMALSPPSATAQEGTPGSTEVPVTVPSTLPATPPDFSISASKAINIANRTDTVHELRATYQGVEAAPQVKSGIWEIYYTAEGQSRALIVISGTSGEVENEWTGAQVAWQMARGAEGQFGHILNAPYVWIPLSLIFFFGLIDFRRLTRVAHLDLLVLLSFSISHIYFNLGEIGVSVPLTYPPLIYLLARMAWIGFRGPGRGLRPSVPVTWLLIATTFLIGFRIAINIADSAVIDVGYAGVIGADRIMHLDPIYGEGVFPPDNPPGDTYGPFNYFAYIPFELAFPWHGIWDDLPSAHAAAIFFDLATIAGLIFLGPQLRRPRRAGLRLGVVLAFAWTAFPYTAFAMQSNTNDALVSALVVWAMVVFASPAGRAVLLALAGMAKFTPFVLVPLFAAGTEGLGRFWTAALPTRRRLALAYFAVVFASVSAVMLVYPAIDSGLAVAWERTIEIQLDRESPFSIWGQVSWLQPLQSALLVAALGFAIALAFVPRKRDLVQICALAAAAIIAMQITLEHWFYPYIPWFLGLALPAIARSFDPPRRRTRRRRPRARTGAATERRAVRSR
jgi:hypothetical protein